MNLHLHHLALGARDVASLAAFYQQVLGLREVARHRQPGDGALRSVWLELGGGAVLMIEKADEPQREPIDGHGAGWFLLAFSADAETLQRCEERLLGQAIAAEQATQFTRYFRDPEGNRFALSRYPLPG